MDRAYAASEEFRLVLQLSRMKHDAAGIRQELSGVLVAAEAAESAGGLPEEGTAARVAALRRKLSSAEVEVAQTQAAFDRAHAHLLSLPVEVETQEFRPPAFYATMPPRPDASRLRQLDTRTQAKVERLQNKVTELEWELFRMRCNEDDLKWELEEAAVAVKAAKRAGREPDKRVTERIIAREFVLGIAESETERMEEELKDKILYIRSLMYY